MISTRRLFHEALTSRQVDMSFFPGLASLGGMFALTRLSEAQVTLLREQHSSASTGELRMRLLREARTMAQLRHPHIVAVHDVGAYGRGLFLAMDFVLGDTLRRRGAS